MEDVVIVSGCRTAIGSFGGTLMPMKHGANLAAVTMKEAIKRAAEYESILDPGIEKIEIAETL